MTTEFQGNPWDLNLGCGRRTSKDETESPAAATGLPVGVVVGGEVERRWREVLLGGGTSHEWLSGPHDVVCGLV